MMLMRTPNAALALLLSAALAAPGAAQVRAAAGALGSAVPRVAAAPAPLSAPSLTSALPSLAAPMSPAVLAASPAAAPLAAAPAAAAAIAVAAPVAAAAAPVAVPLAAAPAAAAADRELRSADAPVSPRDADVSRTAWDRFWSGSADRPRDDSTIPAFAEGLAPSPARLARPWAPRAWAAAAAAVPAVHGFSAFVAHASPFVEAGAVLVGTYFANRAVHRVLNNLGTKHGLDRHQVAVIRLVTSVVLWTAATAAALKLGGAPAGTLTTVFGAGGTLLTLGLRDVLGNVIQGVNFLITRPYTIGARVTIDEQLGTVADVSLTSMLIKKDDGSEVKIRHSALAAKPVIVQGAYQYPDAKLHLAIPAKPKFQGVLGVVWKSLDRPFLLAAGAFAVLAAAPAFVPALGAGWAAIAAHYALAGSLTWLTRRVDVALGRAVDALASQNGWHKETAAITRLAVSAALWAVGGGAALRLLGVSWTALAASVGLTTLGVGLASNNFFGSVVQGGEILFSKPFKVGDHVKIGAFEGTVEDMTLYHVVIKLDEGRHALVPYAVVRDATLVVTPGQNNQ